MDKNYNYDLAIAYRIYPKISKTPAFFPTDKLLLSELCLCSLKQSLGSLKVKMYALLDNCPIEYTHLFQKYFKKEDLEIINLPGIGNLGTFGQQIEILLNQKDSEYVFFSEDDYFYLPNEFNKIIELLKIGHDYHFITPYDHLDFYTTIHFKSKKEIRVSSGKHWMNVPATCCTFLTTKSVLNNTFKILRIYTKKFNEGIFWLSLTKYNLLNPIKLIKYFKNDKKHFETIVRCWKNEWKQIIFGKKWKLWTPIPSIGTHMEKDFLSPNINWNIEFERVKSEMAIKNQ